VFYYGCQRRACDYYFQEEWEECEKLGIIQMRVATSREGENLYVQKLMEKNQEEIKAYLLEKEAVFYICGSEKMGRDVNNVFISIIKKTGVTPYAAMNKIKTMEKAGRIMKEIYG
jgi:sulfite reductase alpha subunit-like flavoprotein